MSNTMELYRTKDGCHRVEFNLTGYPTTPHFRRAEVMASDYDCESVSRVFILGFNHLLGWFTGFRRTFYLCLSRGIA